MKQRTTLSYLLLQPNRVVATSQLLDALWPLGESPSSARKILQNAVSGLRGALPHCPSGTTGLLTRPPGYMLRLADDDLDLKVFQKRAEEGRELAERGAHREASSTFRTALGLWRGPALSDLVEAGVSWPELDIVQNSRLDVLEDLFDSELACGRHQTVLPELEQMYRTEALRERSCGQLMLALYRSGRQADALNAYGRMRTVLVEKLGLEPSRELQNLQQDILNHSEDLLAHQRSPERIEAATATAATEYQPPASGTSPFSEDDCPEMVCPDTGALLRPSSMTWLPPSQPVPSAQRQQVSVVLIHTQIEGDLTKARTADIDALMDLVADTVPRVTRLFGGVVASSNGSVAMLLFQSEDCADRAVRAALSFRELLNSMADPTERSHHSGLSLAVSVSVNTGEALVRHTSGSSSAPLIHGGLPEASHSMLSRVVPGEVLVCDTTRSMTNDTIAYEQRDAYSSSVWGPRGQHTGGRTLPLLDRDDELALLNTLLERCRNRSRPHMTTLLGEPGVGKSQLALEFTRRLGGTSTQTLMGRTPAYSADGALEVHSQILADYCGIAQEDPTSVVTDKLRWALSVLIDCEESVQLLASQLSPLVIDDAAPDQPVDRGQILAAWRVFVRELARHRPLVLVIDDLHRAHSEQLAFFSTLSQWVGDVPLMVILLARPELLQARPGWGGGVPHSNMITLDPLSDAAIDSLLEQGAPTNLPAAAGLRGLVPDSVFHNARCVEDLRSHVRTVLSLSRCCVRENTPRMYRGVPEVV